MKSKQTNQIARGALSVPSKEPSFSFASQQAAIPRNTFNQNVETQFSILVKIREIIAAPYPSRMMRYFT
jgi:hypothetical protein